MLVLHGGVLNGKLLLWGEVPPERGSARTPQDWPFDAGFNGLAHALRQLAPQLEDLWRRPGRALLFAPTRGGRAVPSSPLIGGVPAADGAESALGRFHVTVFSCDADDAAEVLLLVRERRTAAPGVVVAADLCHLADAARFAASLVARQRYLPGVQTGERPTARFEPVLVGDDAVAADRLAAELPPAARALGELDAMEPPERAARDVMRTLLAELVDGLVRAGVARIRAVLLARLVAGDGSDSVHEAWLRALVSSDAVLEADDAQATDLARAAREWRRPLAMTEASPFRLCFRLEPPDAPAAEPAAAEGAAARAAPAEGGAEEPAAAWLARFMIQPHADPSLLLTPSEALEGRSAAAVKLLGSGDKLRDPILAWLAQAARVFPAISGAIEDGRLVGVELDTLGAHDFLVEKAPALEQAGFGVLLPSWWTPKGAKTRLQLRARVKSPRAHGAAVLSLDEVVRFDWEVALGEETLTLRELQALAKLKTPLVRIRGRYVEMSAAELEAAADFFTRRHTDQATVRDLLRLAFGAKETIDGLHVEGVRASGWIGGLVTRLRDHARLPDVEVPRGFRGELRPYQARGLAWLAFLRDFGLGACLADDMGLGKTIQTLALLQRDWELGRRRPVLLVCPTSVVNNWRKEAERFTPELPVLVHHGVARTKGDAFHASVSEHAVILSSYALLHRDHELLRAVKWQGVVLDEAQNVKNPETKQSRASRSLEAEYRLALTGTPVENSVGDLWSILEFLNPGLLGTQAEFQRAFFVPIQVERDQEARERLKRLTGPFVLRRVKTDKTILSDLPEKQEMKVYCALTKEQASLYAAVVKETEAALKAARGIERRGLVLATLLRLKQVCNHPAHFLGDGSRLEERSGKLARLTEMLDEILAVGERALVFSQFAEMGDLLRRHLQDVFGREVLFLHGGVPKAERDVMVDRFQAEGEGPGVFVLSLKAGGIGLNLTRANHVFHFDRWWNPAVENQATDRAFRIGQTRAVQVHKFICAGTLEEKIDEMIERKRDVADAIVGAGEAWLTELSDQELGEVLRLRDDAVAQ